jgi:uncharacterized membrane protein
MNAAHFHLMFNHLPIVGLGFALLINLLAIIRKSEELKRLSSWFYILVGLMSIVPIITGDGAQEILLTYPGINKDAIENHETWGYIFFYGLLLNGVLSVAALWFSGKKPDLVKKLSIATLILALILTFFAFQTGTTGGKMRHPEIEQGTYNK